MLISFLGFTDSEQKLHLPCCEDRIAKLAALGSFNNQLSNELLQLSPQYFRGGGSCFETNRLMKNCLMRDKNLIETVMVVDCLLDQ